MFKEMIVFVCGTPSNDRGFQYKVLENTFSDQSINIGSVYLDKYNTKTMKGKKSYILQQIHIDYQEYKLIVEYRAVIPKDGIDRGAYIAAGVLLKEELTLNKAISLYALISEVHGKLSAHRVKNQFSHTFNLLKFSFDSALYRSQFNSAFLLDNMLKLSSDTETKPIIYTGNKNIYYPTYSLNTHDEIINPAQEKIKNAKNTLQQLQYSLQEEEQKVITFCKESIQTKQEKINVLKSEIKHFKKQQENKSKPIQEMFPVRREHYDIRNIGKERYKESRDNKVHKIWYLFILLPIIFIISLVIGYFYLKQDRVKQPNNIQSYHSNKPTTKKEDDLVKKRKEMLGN